MVADEVRTLAQRTQESTQQIQSIIDRLQSGTANAVDAMKQSKESSTLGLEKTREASSSFDKIADVIVEINGNSMQIASAAEEQHATTDEVSKNVVVISSASENNTQNMVTIAEASEELSKLAAGIKDMLASYKA